jgi:hypothetical protein
VLLARRQRGEARRRHAACAGRCLRASSERPRALRFLGSILVLADETVFCLFDGLEADVRTVSEQAGVPFERVLESLRIDGSQSIPKEGRCGSNV